MQKPYEIVNAVLDVYRALPVKLARITGKTDTWWRSHGYEPRTANPLSNGNPSDVDKYMAFVERYQAAEPGAGAMLNHRVHGELDARFNETDMFHTTQSDIHVGVINEVCDVNKWLAAKDLESASTRELSAFETECDEAIEALHDAKAKARSLKREKQIVRAI